MDPSRFAAFLVADLILVMTPGADSGYAITAGVRGHKVAPAVAGLGVQFDGAVVRRTRVV